MVTHRDHATPQLAPSGQAVDPSHRVPVLGVGLGHPGHASVQVRGPLGIHEHPRCLDRHEPQGRVGDDSGEAHAARGRPKELRLLFRATFQPRRWCRQLETLDVRADCPVPMVVLAMDIAGDCSTYRDISRTGSHWDEETLGHDHTQQGVERAAGVDFDATFDVIQLHDAVECGAVDDSAAGTLGGIAVGTPESAASGDRAR